MSLIFKHWYEDEPADISKGDLLRVLEYNINANKWFRTKDKLPPKGKPVLGCFEDGWMVVCYISDIDDDLIIWQAHTDDGFVGAMDFEPDWWMELHTIQIKTTLNSH